MAQNTATGAAPPAPKTSGEGAQYAKNNSPNANHGASPAPNRASRFTSTGQDVSGQTPGAAR